MVNVSNDPILRQFLAQSEPVKPKIQALYLFGSRARGTERPDSDYDLLCVVSDDFSFTDKDRLYDGVINVLLETGRLVSLKIFRQHDFQRLCDLETPFISRVMAEGIRVG